MNAPPATQPMFAVKLPERKCQFWPVVFWMTKMAIMMTTIAAMIPPRKLMIDRIESSRMIVTHRSAKARARRPCGPHVGVTLVQQPGGCTICAWQYDRSTGRRWRSWPGRRGVDESRWARVYWPPAASAGRRGRGGTHAHERTGPDVGRGVRRVGRRVVAGPGLLVWRAAARRQGCGAAGGHGGTRAGLWRRARAD